MKVEEGKGIIDAMPDKHVSNALIRLGISRSGPATTGSLV